MFRSDVRWTPQRPEKQDHGTTILTNSDEGLLLADLEQWRMALDEEGRASKATTKRIRKLERELAHKEKALAEAAALLVLKKKSNTFGRTRTTTPTRRARDDSGSHRTG